MHHQWLSLAFGASPFDRLYVEASQTNPHYKRQIIVVCNTQPNIPQNLLTTMLFIPYIDEKQPNKIQPFGMEIKSCCKYHVLLCI